MKLIITNPTQTVFERDGLSAVQCPSEDGFFQILHNHAPMIAVIAKGQIRFELFGKEESEFVDVNPGVLHVSDNTITILSEI
jgi:F-type H+-transporting ATPase subunit epsilon